MLHALQINNLPGLKFYTETHLVQQLTLITNTTRIVWICFVDVE